MAVISTRNLSSYKTDIAYTKKRNLIITINRILFNVLVQYLISIIKHNNSNQPFDNNY